MKKSFDDPPKTYQQQIELLKSRGMVIADPEEAEFYLQHLNYSRLSDYWDHFKVGDSKSKFENGVDFKKILDIYFFDRKLRFLIFEAIEQIEISFRAVWAYEMAHSDRERVRKDRAYRSYLDESLFYNKDKLPGNIKMLKEEIKRSKERLVMQFKENYGDVFPKDPSDPNDSKDIALLPVWQVSEMMSFGLLSNFYSNLECSKQDKIAKIYDLSRVVMCSWLFHLSKVRNICAHHASLWGKNTFLEPDKSLYPPFLKDEWKGVTKGSFYEVLLILLYLTKTISKKDYNDWPRQIRTFFLEKSYLTKEMDFPDSWEKRLIWQFA